MKTTNLSQHTRIEPLETRIAPAFVSGTVNLANLSGGDGFTFTSGVANGFLGINVAGIGDINGDGFDDVMATPSNTNNAPAMVLFGKAGGFPVGLTAAQLDGSNGFRIGGGVVGAAQRVGDFDGDGIDDLLVCGSSDAYLLRGHAGVFPADLDLATLDGTKGFHVSGLSLPPGVDQNSLARLVAGADVNGDGFADLIIPGSRVSPGSYDAHANVIFGRAGAFPASFAASTISGSVGFKIGGNDSELAGVFVAGLGDINGDGFDEIALKSSGNGSRVFVIYGHDGAFSNIGLAPLSAADGFTITTAGGSSVGAAGDVNGDGLADIIVGKPGGSAGAAVIYGKTAAFPAVVDPSTLTVTDGFRIIGTAGDNLGGTVEGAGDVNGDGLADVIVSATGVGGTGGAYVIFGKTTRTGVDFSLGSLASTDGFVLPGAVAGDFAGTSVGGGGDVNGDGFADVMVSASSNDAGGNNAGAAYVVFGGPGGTFINPTFNDSKTAIFTDVDGDLVTVKVSKGTLTNANFKLLKPDAANPGAQLLSLTLDGTFDGADVSITAKRAGGGDGYVNVGFIDADNIDLGKVTVGGDLGKIVAGDVFADTAVKSLTVDSLGRFGGRTGDTGAGLASHIIGPLGTVTIAGDVNEASLTVTDAGAVESGKIGSLIVGGSLIGGTKAFSGRIFVRGDLGSAKIAGDLQGGRGNFSGHLEVDGKIPTLTVGGSLIGGAGVTSGAATSLGLIGSIKIGGDLRGGSGTNSGQLNGNGLGAVTVGGSQLGGAGSNSAMIFSSRGIGKVSIAHDQIGGLGSSSGAIQASAVGSIAGVTIGGDARTSAAKLSGGIFAGITVGPVSIKGDVIGTTEQPYRIQGGGALSGATSVAVSSILVGGDLDHALILGGVRSTGFGLNGHAQIGTITVGGDWIASTAGAGLLTQSGATDSNGALGNGDDAFINAGPAGVVASIKSVTIKGTVRGTFEDGDRFAIVAEQIGSVSIGGVKLPLTKSAKGADPANDLAAIHIGLTPDFVVREISRTAAQPVEPFVATPGPGSRSALPFQFELGALGNVDGFTVSAAAPGDQAGDAVSDAGDVNGDGFDDFIVGANRVSADLGATYVVFGQAGGLGSSALSALNGTNGFKLNGPTNSALTPSSVSGAGDVNGDGFDDLIVGSSLADVDGGLDDDSGAAYLIFGRSSFAAVGTAGIDPAALDGTNGFTLTGAARGDLAGTSVGGAGDVNGDGFDDVIIGAAAAGSTAITSGPGAAYVVFGKSHFASAPAAGFAIGLGTLDGSNGFTLTGEDNFDSAGISVSGVGDINGDGYADVAVGAYSAEEAGGNTRGAAYVIFGKKKFTSTPAAGFSIGLGTLQGTDGFKLTGEGDFDRAGFSVGPAGDVNGDGFGDMIVGAIDAGNGGTKDTGPGAAYLIFGRSNFVPGPSVGFSIGLGTLDGDNGFKLGGVAAHDLAGRSVHGAGDVNGDGFADLIVGAPYANAVYAGGVSGAAYVVFGKTRFTSTPTAGFSIGLGTLNGVNGFKLSGANGGDQAGRSVSAAGDINGDGFGDVIVGSRFAGVDDAGVAYVVYGGPSGEFIDPTISADGKTATWIDVDDDVVTLKVSKGALDANNFKLLAKSTADGRAQLLRLDLGSTFDTADVSITAKRAGGGDGMVNVGAIDAVGVDLGTVKIGGDLGSLRAGDVDAGLAFKSLTVGSLGVFGARTQDTGGQLLSSTSGPAGALKILGDVRDAAFAAISSGIEPGSLASVTIGGDVSGTGPLLGPSNLFLLGQIGPGTIAASNTMGPVKIGGDLVGGVAANSGYLLASSIASVSLGGSLVGGAGQLSGAVFGDTLGSISIGGSQLGGAGGLSGGLIALAGIGKVSIRGDQIGGVGAASGLIFTQNPGANIASVSIGGDARGGDAVFSGGILAGGTLGPVSIKGDVIGTPGEAYTIRGSGPLTGTKSVAIAGLKVGGDFDHALILAGYGANNVPANGHAQIGAISIGRDWIASIAAAGVIPFLGATNAVGIFGDSDDKFISAGGSAIASIASITIKGRAIGTLETGDRFAIVAEQIGAVSIGGVKVTPSANPFGPTPDFIIRTLTR